MVSEACLARIQTSAADLSSRICPTTGHPVLCNPRSLQPLGGGITHRQYYEIVRDPHSADGQTLDATEQARSILARSYHSTHKAKQSPFARNRQDLEAHTPDGQNALSPVSIRRVLLACRLSLSGIFFLEYAFRGP